MKCVRLKDGKIKRVLNDVAYNLVNNEGAKFISKESWKTEKRDINKKKATKRKDKKNKK